MSISRKDLMIFISSLLLFAVGIFAYGMENYPAFAIITTCINLLFIYKFLSRIPILIIFLFIFFYTSTFNYFFLNSISISFWGDFQTIFALKKVLLSHSLFIFFLGNCTFSDSNEKSLDFVSLFKPNKKVAITFLVICILILIFGIQGKSLLEGGVYFDQESATKSTFHEYFILCFYFLILFSPRSLFFKNIQRILFVFFVLKTLIFGGRIEVVEIGILWFYLYYVFKDKIRVYTILFLSIIGFYSLNVMSNIRANPIGFLSGEEISKFFNPTNMFIKGNDVDFISTNEGDVIQSSARIVGLIDSNELKLEQRVLGPILFILSPIVPTSLLPDYANLASFKQDKYRSGGGGLISIYFYSWLWYFGPILIGVFLAYIFNSFFRITSVYVYVYGTMALVMFPRWFAYNPIILVKFCAYSLIILIMVNLISKSKFISTGK